MHESSLDLTDEELADMLWVIDHAMRLGQFMSDLMEDASDPDPKLFNLLLDLAGKSKELTPRIKSVLTRRRSAGSRLH